MIKNNNYIEMRNSTFWYYCYYIENNYYFYIKNYFRTNLKLKARMHYPLVLVYYNET